MAGPGGPFHLLRSAWPAMLAGLFFSCLPASAGLPWKAGEELTYEVHWGVIVAAEATFSADREGPLWKMNLDLKSRGVVESFNPIRSRFTSRMQALPWKSFAFEEDRAEGKKIKKNKTTLLPGRLKGRYEDLLEKSSLEFEIPRESMDDLGSLLYAMRTQDWKKEKEKLFVVYDGPKIKYGRARFAGESEESLGIWPRQKLLVVEAWPEDENGKRKKGSLKMWITDDEKRVPLKADLAAKFGTFEINLVRMEPGLR